ncbi:uncharacterized protein LOC123217519 [Mangifera indica]|uniref:uncharacterized protein LOC123217519 n=1 Tax=Mangifera indica TaxID=29780 RepID=UPI001CFBC661|nr:uncharacterized protein LOC123217519 [Mangifera indica]XP_044494526.1 uncharacterized protein LOC123217519 [Mangifera indica]
MNLSASKERDLEADLESSETSEEDRTKDSVSVNRQTNRIFSWTWTGQFSSDGSVHGKCGNLCSESSNFGEAAGENVELLMDKNSEEEGWENVGNSEKCVEGKRKKTNSRKPPKPPRPPKGPTLDAADQKLVREIAEHAMRKRARIERIKALKRMKAEKASASNSTIFAMIITLIFCLVIVFQGLCSGNSISFSMLGSPASAVTASESLVSVQFYKSFSAYERNGSGSGSPILAEGQVSSSPSKEELSKVSRRE